MAALRDILYKVSISETIGNTGKTISSIEYDSRKVQHDALFVAVAGTLTDGHRYIEQATSGGASVVVCESLPENINRNVTYIKVENSGEALGIMASNFFGNPSDDLVLTGITGTNGKTTVATLLYELFRSLGYPSGLLSTIRIVVDEKEYDATHTTPDAIQINNMLRKMADAGCSHCFMEVSSHAIHQDRIAGLDFNAAVFTNLTHDHLDYHGTFREYLAAKKKFFDGLSAKAVAIINIDDRNGSVMTQNTPARVMSYGLRKMADYKSRVLESGLDGSELELNGNDFWCRMVGDFNAYNITAVYAIASELGIGKEELLKGLSELNTVEGRFDRVETDSGITGLIDYAHTPDALENVLSAISKLRTGSEQLITVAGAGGDRDAAKRPLMGNVAAKYSNKVILTSDNPRSEDPDAIIEEMFEGIDAAWKSRVIKISNRKEAIRAACTIAGKGDIILVAGKGHEKYQEIKGKKSPFDDKKFLEEFLAKKDQQ